LVGAARSPVGTAVRGTTVVARAPAALKVNDWENIDREENKS
jgi:hypothetical protein